MIVEIAIDAENEDELNRVLDSLLDTPYYIKPEYGWNSLDELQAECERNGMNPTFPSPTIVFDGRMPEGPEMITLAEVSQRVVDLLVVQQQYFKARDRDKLIESKRLEKELRTICLAALQQEREKKCQTS